MCSTFGTDGTCCSVREQHGNEEVNAVFFFVYSTASLFSILLLRVYGQFTLEIILSTAFGHQAEILRGKAENDELYKAAILVVDSITAGGPFGMFGSVAVQCELSIIIIMMLLQWIV